MSDLYELPKGWEWKKFQELFTITSSKRVHKKDWLSKGIPFYRAREIVKLSQNGFVDNELFISEEMYNTFVDKYGAPKKDDILVTGVGTLGIPYIVKENDKFYFKDGNIIWLKNDSNTNSKFIEYSFQSEFIKNQINSNSGSTVATYTITNANNTIIPLPPLSEQQRIVLKLDKLFEKIDKAIALHQKNMDEADVFMGSVLNDVFVELEEKYGLKEINSLFKIKSGNFLPAKNMVENGEINVYGGNGINGKHNEFNLSGENILIGRVGALCGNVRCVNDNIWLTDNAFYISEYFENIDKNFLTQMLIHIDLGSSANKSAQPVISYKSISEMTLPLPPLQIQQKVVSYLDEISQKIEKIKQIQKEKMESLKALKASILDQAFRGEL